ncbi:unnamed protein product [Adineta steineri]|uniref:Leucine-rich repeat and WD repeat-containing protein 1 n=1 Tax=Adineta steineri TaxID=433720 RepID=A0A814D729_9BILA|nr:unnamed protein product [Adineta steineri]CAF3644672.1 unnamed protein product [Adineta steineri]
MSVKNVQHTQLSEATDNDGYSLKSVFDDDDSLQTDHKSSHVRCISMSSNRKSAVIGQTQGPLQIWDVVNGKLISCSEDTNINCNKVKWARHGTLLVYLISDPSNSQKNIIQICDAKNGNSVELDYQINCATFTLSNDTEKVVMVGNRKNGSGISVAIFDLDGFELVKEIKSIENQSYGDISSFITLTPNERYAIVGCSSGLTTKYVVFDFTTEEDIIEPLAKTIEADPLCSVALNNEQILTGTTDGQTIVWDISSCESIHTLTDNGQSAHEGKITNVKLSPDRQYVVTSSVDGTVKVWDANTKELISKLIGHKEEITCTCITTNQMIVTGSKDKNISLWHLRSGKLLATISVSITPFDLRMGAYDRTIVSIGDKNGDTLITSPPPPLHCSQYSNDLEIIHSLSSNVSVINESHICRNLECAWINTKNQVIPLLLTYTPESLQVYCLTNLQKLLLPSNSPWRIPTEIANLIHLTELNLNIAGNKIPQAIGKLRMLQSLTFTADEVTELPGAITLLSKLKFLFIDAPLKEIPAYLSLIPLQTLIFLRRSNFSSIPDKFFERLNPSLRDLTIDITHLKSLDPFLALTELGSLTVYAEKLKEFPWQFTHLTALRQLSLNNNELSFLPRNFSENFDTLYFDFNHFSQVPRQILGNKNLVKLYLNNNWIVDISTIFQMKAPLKILFVGFNNITTLPATINSLTDSLQSLDLHGNKLTTVPAEELVKMNKLTFLFLEGNQIAPDEVARLKAIFSTNPRITVFF